MDFKDERDYFDHLVQKINRIDLDDPMARMLILNLVSDAMNWTIKRTTIEVKKALLEAAEQ